MKRTCENFASAAGTLIHITPPARKPSRTNQSEHRKVSVHMSAVISTSEVILKLRSERNRDGLVFSEGGFCSVAGLGGGRCFDEGCFGFP